MFDRPIEKLAGCREVMTSLAVNVSSIQLFSSQSSASSSSAWWGGAQDWSDARDGPPLHQVCAISHPSGHGCNEDILKPHDFIF